MRGLSSSARNAILRLVDDLVVANYAAIEADGRIGRLTQQELRRAVADYGRTLASVPVDELDDVDVYPSDVIPGRFAVDLSLWTVEEGRGDLTLSLTVVESENAAAVSIDDLHVL